MKSRIDNKCLDQIRLDGCDLDKFSQEENADRTWVFSELIQLDHEIRYLVDQTDMRKLIRKVLVARLYQVAERN